jgi:hypothetical protein
MNDFLLNCFCKPRGLGWTFSALCNFDVAVCRIAQTHDYALCGINQSITTFLYAVQLRIIFSVDKITYWRVRVTSFNRAFLLQIFSTIYTIETTDYYPKIFSNFVFEFALKFANMWWLSGVWKILRYSAERINMILCYRHIFANISSNSKLNWKIFMDMKSGA